MPHRHHVDVKQGLGLIVVSGRVTGTTLVEAAAALAGDEAWSPAFDRLWDCTGITFLDMTPKEQLELARLLSTGRGRAGRAALVASRDLDEMVGRVFQGFLKKDHPVGIFRSMDRALAWLDKSLPMTEQP